MDFEKEITQARVARAHTRTRYSHALSHTLAPTRTRARARTNPIAEVIASRARPPRTEGRQARAARVWIDQSCDRSQLLKILPKERHSFLFSATMTSKVPSRMTSVHADAR
jgi:hypothetical protein